MKKERGTNEALETVVFLGLLTLATDRLPTALSGCGALAWVCVLLSGVVLLVIFWGLGAYFAKEETKKEGRFLALLLLLWGLFWTGVQAGSVGHRVAHSLRASPVLLSAVLLLLVGWMVSGALPALTRAGAVFVSAVGVGFLLIVLFGVMRLDYPRLVAFQPADLRSLPVGILSVLGILSVGFYALVLREAGEPSEESHGLAAPIGLLLLLTLAVVLVLGRFGAALTGQLDRPFFQMVSGLGLEGGFQRLEAVVSALWLLGDVALLTLILLSLRHLTATVLGRPERVSMGWWLTAAAFLVGLPVTAFSVDLRGLLFPVGNLIAGGLLIWRYGKRGG